MRETHSDFIMQMKMKILMDLEESPLLGVDAEEQRVVEAAL